MQQLSHNKMLEKIIKWYVYVQILDLFISGLFNNGALLLFDVWELHFLSIRMHLQAEPKFENQLSNSTKHLVHYFLHFQGKSM